MVSTSRTQGSLSNGRTQYSSCSRSHLIPLASSILLNARRTESSLTTFFIPSSGALTASARSAVMCAYRQCPASTDSSTVPSTSRLPGAFGLVSRSGQPATQPSNRPLCFRYSMKNASWPIVVTGAAGSHSR